MVSSLTVHSRLVRHTHKHTKQFLGWVQTLRLFVFISLLCQDEDISANPSTLAVTSHPVAERLDTLMAVLIGYVKDICYVNGKWTVFWFESQLQIGQSRLLQYSSIAIIFHTRDYCQLLILIRKVATMNLESDVIVLRQEQQQHAASPSQQHVYLSSWSDGQRALARIITTWKKVRFWFRSHVKEALC